MRSMLSNVLLSIGCCLLLVTSTAIAAADEEFPGRALYEEVPYIGLDELNETIDEKVVVDVRSSYEYSTLRIKGAINIPLSSDSFLIDMKKLRDSDPRQIVVYCNGKTCMKSYKAAKKCLSHGVENVVSFDAGVLDWSKAQPKKALLLGKTLRDPAKLISKDQLAEHLVTPDGFGELVANTKGIVLDVRDRFQREGLSIFVGREYRVDLDDKKKINKYVSKARKKKQPLLIYDAAGKQVRWLQYYLESQGVEEYYFMKGGIRSYFNELKEDLEI